MGKTPARYFSEICLEYTRVHVKGPLAGAKESYHRCAKRWLARWEMSLLEELDGSSLSMYFAELLHREFTPQQMQEDGGFLKQLFDWSVRAGYVEVNPFAEIRTLKHRPQRRAIVWDAAEQAALLDAAKPVPTECSEPQSVLWLFFAERSKKTQAPPYVFPIVFLGLRTGLRLGSLIYLKWDNVKLGDQTLRFGGQESRFSEPFEVALDSECVDVLRQLDVHARKDSHPPRRVFDSLALPYLFGAPDYREVQAQFRAACNRAEIREAEFNSLRHSFAFNCARSGMSLMEAKSAVDWDDDELLVRMYDKFSPMSMEMLTSRSRSEPSQ
jgi:integrase